MSRSGEKKDPQEKGEGEEYPDGGPQKSSFDRLEALKKRRFQTEKENKIASYQEENQRRFNAKRKGEIVENEEQRWDNREMEITGTGNKEKDDRERNWTWSIEECEKWDEKQRLKSNTQKQASGFQNYTVLAEKAYAKEICNQPADMEEYQRQKRIWLEPKPLENKSFKPNPVDVDSLALSTKESVNRKRKRRNHESNSIDGYINDKNKHFNRKLARELHKFEESFDKKK